MNTKTYQTGWASEAFAAALVAHNAVVEFGRVVLKHLREHRVRERRYRQLIGMDARELKDIGLTPSDIQAVVDGTYFFDASRRHRYGEFRSVLRTTTGLVARI